MDPWSTSQTMQASDVLSARQFNRVEPVAAYETVLHQVRRMIHLGELLPGDKLPSERVLAEELGIARVTLREAIRILQGEGIVRVEGRGSNRHTVVLPPRETIEHLQTTLKAQLDMLMDIYDLRAAVEPAAARLAATRRTETNIAVMQRAVDDLARSTSIATFLRADSAFHIAVAIAARNSRFRPIIEEARAALYQASDVLEHGAALRASIRDHSRVLLWIERGEPSRAESAMRRHVEFARGELLSLLGVNQTPALS
jgi:GntR family transcriptional repressor for pyruvate dehydrogenase complex